MQWLSLLNVCKLFALFIYTYVYIYFFLIFRYKLLFDMKSMALAIFFLYLSVLITNKQWILFLKLSYIPVLNTLAIKLYSRKS